MTERCPCCHGTGLATAPPDPLEQLRAWLLERGHWVGPGDVTDTRGAAAALAIEPQTLRADRCLWQRVPFHRVGRRIEYRLADLVMLICVDAPEE